MQDPRRLERQICFGVGVDKYWQWLRLFVVGSATVRKFADSAAWCREEKLTNVVLLQAEVLQSRWSIWTAWRWRATDWSGQPSTVLPRFASAPRLPVTHAWTSLLQVTGWLIVNMSIDRSTCLHVCKKVNRNATKSTSGYLIKKKAKKPL